MEKTSDGFELANEDLLIRGPGDFWGVKQHGLNQLKVANLLRDQEMIRASSEAAASFSPQQIREEKIDHYIGLKFKENALIAMN
jgi:ATP-dependent DNA helicase RecG